MTMMEEEYNKQRRVRTSHPKVRTGCLTCKRRHKKCDENRPSCRMCISSGRECEGYSSVPDKRTKAARRMGQASIHVPILAKTSTTQQCQRSLAISQVSVALDGASQVDLDPAERWHLRHFRESTASHCGGYFHDEFWHRLVHRLSEEQPAVRHAAIAMSARHYQFERLQLGLVLEGEDDYMSLRQCNKAMACLRQYLSKEQSGTSRKEVILATCVVLVCLALFEEDPHAADYHFQSGHRLLQEWQKENFNDNSSGPTFIETFAQLQLHRSTCADPKTFVEDEHPSLPSPDADNSRPEKCNDNSEIVNHFIVVLGWLILPSNPNGFSIGPANSCIRSGEAAVLSVLRLWRTQLKRSVMLHGNNVSQVDRNALTLFALWSEVIYIKVITSSQSGSHEMSYDNLLAHFQRAVVLVKSLIVPSKGHSLLSTFSPKAAIIPPLFFCGFKCRDWLIRRQVMLLLNEFKDHEDIWISRTILVLERLIEIESEGIGPGEKVPEYARVDSMHVNIQPQNSQIHLWYRRSRSPDNSDNGDELWENELLSASAER